MTTYVRSFNPIWIFRDLEGQPLNDEYYAFFLEPDLPYLPKSVYSTSNGTAMSNPRQLLANGALPNNLYFEPDSVYRIEIRHGSTQADQLVYEVNNYVVEGAGGDTSVDLLPENQLTNPQFNEVSFDDTTTITTEGTFDIAPGWEVVTSGGSGQSLTINWLVHKGTDNIASNPTPPYTLQFISTGFISVKLKTRFNGNGALWQRRALAFTGTFKSTVTEYLITASYVPSTGDSTLILSRSTTTALYRELRGANVIPQSTNATDSNDAYVDIEINIPVEANIEVGNLQLLPQDIPQEISFKEDTIERSIDHTFHLFQESISGSGSNESVLAGWNFPNNPWQYRATTTTNVGSQCMYTADQTIIYQRSGADKVSTERATAADNYRFVITPVTTDNQFAMIQYIDPSIMRGLWGRTLSSRVKVNFTTTHATTVTVKARLLYRVDLPATLSGTEPIASWAAADTPVYSAGWVEVTPLNDPSYSLPDDTQLDFVFDAMQNVNATTDNMTLAIVLYTTGDMDSTATADYMTFDSISLVPNNLPVEANILSFNEDLDKCRFYYERSYQVGTADGTATVVNSKNYTWYMAAPGTARGKPFDLDYMTRKRAAPSNTFFAPTTGASGSFDFGVGIGVSWTPSVILASALTAATNGTDRAYYTNSVTIGGIISGEWTRASFHYTANARLGE